MSCVKTETQANDTVQRHRHELRRLLRPGRKGGVKGAGRCQLLGEPADEFDDGGRHASPEAIIKAVQDAGYGASVKGVRRQRRRARTRSPTTKRRC